MVRTLQIKFVKTAMTAISVLLLAVICAISGIYSFDVYTKEKNTAEMLANSGGIPDFEKMKRDRPDREEFEKPFDGGRMSPDDMMAVRFFVVRFDADGGIESADTGSIYSVTDEEAEEYGKKAAASGKQSGIIGNFMYFIKDNEDGKTAAFVDVSSQISSILSVIVISLIIAAAAWILMLVFVSALSRRAIAPIAENIVRQKQFVTNAGHELKTPLAIILANTEALELFNGESKWTRNIKAQTRRLNDLMQNLLTLSKMDEADLNLPMQDFDLGELVRESAALFEEPAREKRQSLSVETPEIAVKANRDSMGQLVGILLDNAVKYTPEGGEISVTVSREGNSVILREQNTVDPKDVEDNPERLFDRFYRRDEARTQKKGGYGIGLSAARAIAAANGAQINAAYREQNIVFTVKLMV